MWYRVWCKGVTWCGWLEVMVCVMTGFHCVIWQGHPPPSPPPSSTHKLEYSKLPHIRTKKKSGFWEKCRSCSYRWQWKTSTYKNSEISSEDCRKQIHWSVFMTEDFILTFIQSDFFSSYCSFLAGTFTRTSHRTSSNVPTLHEPFKNPELEF